MPSFYEFFAGGGMARAGLGKNWECLFANDVDDKKCEIYRANWGTDELKAKSITDLRSTDIPRRPDLVWASFPCQDLSVAGRQAGLKGSRSGTFWSFLRLLKTLNWEKRAPSVVVLENVCGALTSHQGRDFGAICGALTGGGYRLGALVVDAIHFVPQSRPRLFVVGVQENRIVPPAIISNLPSKLWHPQNLLNAYHGLSRRIKNGWIWWNLPIPPPRKSTMQISFSTNRRV